MTFVGKNDVFGIRSRLDGEGWIGFASTPGLFARQTRPPDRGLALQKLTIQLRKTFTREAILKYNRRTIFEL
jgi:hypothetical protein